MIESHTKQKAGKVCVVLVFTLLLVLIPALIFDFYYDLNDDTTIKDILSGTFTGTPSGYSIQMLYPLSWIIALFYRAIPELPWYGLFLCVCQFGVVVLIGWRLVNIMKTGFERFLSLAVLLLVSFGLFLRELVIVQYSVTSAFCMAGAVFLFATSESTDKASKFIKQNTVAVALVIISFMIRTEMCLMLMPFLFLFGLVKWGQESRIFTAANFKKYLVLIGAAFVGMLAVFSIDKVAYGSSEWSSFRTFFNARTDLYDFYGLPLYEGENEEFYNLIGLSKESYTLLENYNYALDESIDSWMLKSISDYQKAQAKAGNGLSYTFGFVSKNSLGEAVWLYKNHILSGITNPVRLIATGGIKAMTSLSGDAFRGYAVVAAYAVYITIFLFMAQGKPKRQSVTKIIGLLIIRSVLWLYLYMVDRVIQRVTTPLLMLELCVLVLFIMQDIKYAFGKMANIAVYLIAAVFLALAVNGSFKTVNSEYELRAQADERWNSLIDYCAENENSFYVIDVYSSTSYNGAAYSEKIFKNVDNSYRNFDICGGWAAKSPLSRKKLAMSGIKDIQSALCADKAYFVAAGDKDLTWLSRYYGKRGYDVALVCEDVIYTSDSEPAFMVYRISNN
jgi:hypothetical protein